MGIIGSILRKRESPAGYRTVDGGHPAPYPDMTDEQLYNYELVFNVPRKTFEHPPASSQAEAPPTTGSEKVLDSARFSARRMREAALHTRSVTVTPPLDLSKPVRLVTTKQPVEIITTRARHPVYKVHAYIGNDEVATVFTLDGRLSENGPCFLENVPERRELYLNIYPNRDAGDKYLITQHATREEADAAATPERLTCTAVQFDC